MNTATKSLSLLCVLLMSHGCINTRKSSNNQHKGSLMIQTGSTLNLSEYTKLPNGIMFHIVQQGHGDHPLRGETAIVHYSGWLLQGTNIVGKPFDSSIQRGSPFQFPVGLGHVISGWDMMVAAMKIGEKRIVILPPMYGYGSRGAGAVIPPNATLIFEIDLLGVK